MKSFRKRRGVSNLVLLSIGEFAWLVVFFMVIISINLNSDLKQALDENETLKKSAYKNGGEVSINFDEILSKAQSYDEELKEKDAALAKIKRYESTLSETNAKLRKFESTEEENYTLKEELRKEIDVSYSLSQELRRLENISRDKTAEIERLLSNEEIYTSNLSKLKKEIVTKRNSDDTLAGLRNREIAIRTEIIGVDEAELKNVIFAFDRSDSMDSKDGRWQIAQEEVLVWLKYLPIKNISLVDFANKATPFPREIGTYINIRDSQKNIRSDNLKLVTDKFSRTTLMPGTNTYEAIKTAYKYSDATLIILFTDGVPNILNGKRTSHRKVWGEIISFVSKKIDGGQKIPIYAVALGSYDETQIKYLKRIATLTGGNFVGK